MRKAPNAVHLEEYKILKDKFHRGVATEKENDEYINLLLIRDFDSDDDAEARRSWAVPEEITITEKEQIGRERIWANLKAKCFSSGKQENYHGLFEILLQQSSTQEWNRIPEYRLLHGDLSGTVTALNQLKTFAKRAPRQKMKALRSIRKALEERKLQLEKQLNGVEMSWLQLRLDVLHSFLKRFLK